MIELFNNVEFLKFFYFVASLVIFTLGLSVGKSFFGRG